jgi:hypothetical protein
MKDEKQTSIGCDSGFLENGADFLSGSHRISQNLVIGLISSFAGHIIEFPFGGVHVRLDPLLKTVETNE